MTTIHILTIRTGNLSTSHISERQEAIRQAKWYASFKENGENKYRVIIQKKVYEV